MSTASWRGSSKKSLQEHHHQQQQQTDASLKQETDNNNKKKVKGVTGRPVESFSNVVGVVRKVKQACSISDQVPASLQRLLLELPRDEDKELLAD